MVKLPPSGGALTLVSTTGGFSCSQPTESESRPISESPTTSPPVIERDELIIACINSSKKIKRSEVREAASEVLRVTEASVTLLDQNSQRHAHIGGSYSRSSETSPKYSQLSYPASLCEHNVLSTEKNTSVCLPPPLWSTRRQMHKTTESGRLQESGNPARPPKRAIHASRIPRRRARSVLPA